MELFFRTLCTVSCLVSGFYCFLIFHNFKRSIETFWYGIFCIVLGIYSNSEYLIYPKRLSAVNVIDSAGNFFLMSFALAVLILNIYVSIEVPKEKKTFFIIIDCIIGLVMVISFFAPQDLYVYTFVLISALQILILLFAISLSTKQARTESKTYIYAAVAYHLLIVANILKTVLFFTLDYFINPVAFVIPIFTILHIILLSSQYAESLKRTKELSESLSETITKITHSDNALMCTQMKSDFLYKSLDLITKKCDEDPFTAEDLTISLSKYLRHTLNFQQLKGVVPLSNEIELTKSYIAIEKERNKNITFEYHFPDPLPDFHIPPLSIQPLVENAIEHGLSHTGGKVTITIIPYRNYFHIDVSDNGEGMSEELAASLTERLYDSARIGIYNIHTRLNNLFGKGLVVQSALGVGTSVSFVVPLNSEEMVKEELSKNE